MNKIIYNLFKFRLL